MWARNSLVVRRGASGSTARTLEPAADTSCRRRLAAQYASTRALDTAPAPTRNTGPTAAPGPRDWDPPANPRAHKPAIAPASGSSGPPRRVAVDGGRGVLPHRNARGRVRSSSPASRATCHVPYPSKIEPMTANDVYRRCTLGYSSSNIGTSGKAVPGLARSRCYVRNVESWRECARRRGSKRQRLHITDRSTLVDDEKPRNREDLQLVVETALVQRLGQRRQHRRGRREQHPVAVLYRLEPETHGQMSFPEWHRLSFWICFRSTEGW